MEAAKPPEGLDPEVAYEAPHPHVVVSMGMGQAKEFQDAHALGGKEIMGGIRPGVAR